MSKDTHPTPRHHTELPRLNRVAGQIEGIKKMVEEHRYCPDIITQLRAVRAAIKTIESNILETHLQSCVTEALSHGSKEERNQKIAQLKDMFKRFDE